MPQLLAYVFPLSTSQDSEGYTYKVPESISESIGIGDLVSIPFRSETQEGVVADLVVLREELGGDMDELKSIESILIPRILSYPQIRVIAEQAKTLCITIHKVLSLFLPAPYRKRVFKFMAEDTSGIPPYLDTTSSVIVSKNGNEHLNDGETKDSLVSVSLEDNQKRNCKICHIDSLESLIHYAAEFLKTAGSFVIAPNQRYIDLIVQLLESQNYPMPKGDFFVFAADSTDTQKAKAFEEARFGSSKSFVGGRRSIFCDMSRFSRILYLEDGLFKEVNHSFHKYRIFDMLLATSQFSPQQEFTILSITPSIEVASLAIAKKMRFESLLQK